MAPLVLASASPRRRELLALTGIEFEVLAADIDETLRPGEAARDYVARVAREKAHTVQRRDGARRVVLGADTAVVLGGRVLGKPASAANAATMLRALSGRSHEVLSAVAVALPDGSDLAALSHSFVTFAELDERWIDRYCRSGEPLDKAGAYAIQGWAAQRISRVEGSQTGVMGLPLFETAQLLQAAGLDVLPRRFD